MSPNQRPTKFSRQTFTRSMDVVDMASPYPCLACTDTKRDTAQKEESSKDDIK